MYGFIELNFSGKLFRGRKRLIRKFFHSAHNWSEIESYSYVALAMAHTSRLIYSDGWRIIFKSKWPETIGRVNTVQEFGPVGLVYSLITAV